MQKWSPEPFAVVTDPTPPVATEDWQPGTEGQQASAEALFRKDNPLGDQEVLLSQLSSEEREQIYQLVATDVESEYEDKYRQVTIQQQDAIESWLKEFQAGFQQETERKIAILARQTGQIAIAMAEKLVRRNIELDPTVLNRSLHTMLYKVEAGASMTLCVNPLDAEFLAEQEGFLQKLRIKEIVPDRRIERGGCLIQSQDQEWDATIQNQLGVLSEIVMDCLSGDPSGIDLTDAQASVTETGSTENPSPEDDIDDDDPAVE